MTEFRPGDEVFAMSKRGGFAEYVCVKESELAPKPANLTFEQAAAVPLAANTALIGLRDKGRIQPGQKVLINGASGEVRVRSPWVRSASSRTSSRFRRWVTLHDTNHRLSRPAPVIVAG